MEKQCYEEIVIEEGNVGKYEESLSWIAGHSSFNLQQYKVEHASADKNTLVEAGAGTGKTYSMVSRVAFLCNKKHIYDALEPWKVFSQNPSEQSFYMANYDYLLEKIVKFSRIDTLTINQIAKYLEINILTRQQELARTPETDEEGIHIICTTVHKSKQKKLN